MQSEISLTVVAFDAPCLIEERTSVCGMCTHELRTLYSQASNPSPVLWTLFACFMQHGSRTKVTLWHVRLNLRHLKGNSIRLLAHGCTPPSTSHAFFFFAGCKFCFAFCVATEGHLLAFVISRPKASFFFFFFPSVSGWVATNQRLGAVYACYKMLCAGSRNGCSFSPFLTPHFPLSFL